MLSDNCCHPLPTWMNSKYYASSSLAAGRATYGRQVSSKLPDKERYSGSPGSGFRYGADTPILVKKSHTVSDGQKQLTLPSKYTETRNMECAFIAHGWYKYAPLIHWNPSCHWLCQKLHKSVVSRAGKSKWHIGTNRGPCWGLSQAAVPQKTENTTLNVYHCALLEWCVFISI